MSKNKDNGPVPDIPRFQPDVRARPKDGRYILCRPYHYDSEIGGKRFTIQIPWGFDYDGASVPRYLWSIAGITPDGRIRAAALVHDWIYRHGGSLPHVRKLFTRAEADSLFYWMMLVGGVPRRRALRAYYAVRVFGRWSWKKPEKKRNGR